MSEEILKAICKRVFLSGHSEGWAGNQTRRDVQHVDAEKGWTLYVENGALDKAIVASRTPSSPTKEMVEAVARAIWTTPITGQPKGREVRSWPPSHPDALLETMNQAQAALSAISGVGEQPPA